jgi:hypothetical protein
VISKLFGLLSFAASSAVLTFIVSHVGALVALIGVIVLVVKGIVGVPGDGATKPGPSA